MQRYIQYPPDAESTLMTLSPCSKLFDVPSFEFMMSSFMLLLIRGSLSASFLSSI